MSFPADSRGKEGETRIPSGQIHMGLCGREQDMWNRRVIPVMERSMDRMICEWIETGTG